MANISTDGVIGLVFACVVVVILIIIGCVALCQYDPYRVGLPTTVVTQPRRLYSVAPPVYSYGGYGGYGYRRGLYNDYDYGPGPGLMTGAALGYLAGASRSCGPAVINTGGFCPPATVVGGCGMGSSPIYQAGGGGCGMSGSFDSSPTFQAGGGGYGGTVIQ